MTAGVIRSFEPDEGLLRVLLVNDLSERTLRVRGSDKSIVAHLPHGEPIQFQLVHDCRGRACAIDISIIGGRHE